ncbi:MAG TPA: Hpt domain-containing protein [Pirellulaceae bacterium]|nr:Hpt domain-containing protein [Pirellulaceae bacterium]
MNDMASPSLLSPTADPLNGDPDLRKELAALYLADYPQLLARIRQAIGDRSGPELKAAAHSLKGSSGVFRDQCAFDAALRLEIIGSNADWARAEEACQRVCEETGRLAGDLAALIAAP